jgi:hypothetical protein
MLGLHKFAARGNAFAFLQKRGYSPQSRVYLRDYLL